MRILTSTSCTSVRFFFLFFFFWFNVLCLCLAMLDAVMSAFFPIPGFTSASVLGGSLIFPTTFSMSISLVQYIRLSY
ncbi:uncharacterized protein BO97DRAFT_103317 [Aspergillus homomorphus CBS 101889]|uniref:Uncharacterized protein n=1 Tax=Aspergillus homomorphus (strain CBS 101889) TaxID=1450537 RepID=A0A395HTX4_ASPHC|nr:hypothetical protein BO97DRAFT_103317 [Aspergillus homomorphus CBS 101889]RAL11391.1 hypothetical protein BO97DRAFT_103317 [Aspergillus homomorphus CBS 101889]